MTDEAQERDVDDFSRDHAWFKCDAPHEEGDAWVVVVREPETGKPVSRPKFASRQGAADWVMLATYFWGVEGESEFSPGYSGTAGPQT